MTYEYKDLVTGKIHDVQQRITDEPHTHLNAKDGSWLCDASGKLRRSREWHPVKRQISVESGGFRLVRGESGGWSESGYSKKEHERIAEKQLGRKLTKAAT